MNGIKKSIIKQYGENKTMRGDIFKKFYDENIYPKPQKEYYLDIGCQWGETTYTFSKEFTNTVAVDISENDILLAKKRYPNICFIHKDFLNFDSKVQFDFITIFSVLEHLPDPDRAIEKIKGLLKKDGMFLIQIPNKYFFVELHTYLPLLFLFPKKLKETLLNKINYSNDAIFATELSLRNVLKLLKKYDFSYEIMKMIYPPKFIPKEFRTIYRLFNKIGLLDLIPPGYLIIARASN